MQPDILIAVHVDPMSLSQAKKKGGTFFLASRLMVDMSGSTHQSTSTSASSTIWLYLGLMKSCVAATEMQALTMGSHWPFVLQARSLCPYSGGIVP